MRRPMRIRIEGFDLPGRTCAPAPGFPGYSGIRVGVQRRGRADELLDPHPGDAPSATWVLDCTVAAKDTGFDVTGPWIQGRPGGRFVYLSWEAAGEDGTFAMFRRAKLMLDGVAPETLADAVASGLLVARLGLTDGRGQPTCAAVRPPLVVWSAGPAS
ncbi:DUF5990 family protein [Streptomyces sp. NPDC048604]|uniref:DUF5990 family protein n=1 Tax=Streptomyces sp. NPDC048604 TaxID=3365578 RepID=UPI00371D1A25